MDPVLCDYLIEGHEIGADGTPHIQGYCMLRTPLRLTQLKLQLPRAHLEPAKGTPWVNFLYCSKGEQSHDEWTEYKEEGPNFGVGASFQEFGVRPKRPINAHKKKPKSLTYAKAIAAETTKEGMQIVQAEAPRDFCLHGKAIRDNLDSIKQKGFEHKYHPSDFAEPLKSLDKAILFCGPSNTGKTQFALAHFKHPLLVRHIDQLKTLRPDHDGIVFDDMSFGQWPPESVIHLLDIECESPIHARFKNATIPAGTRRIFTHNTQNPFYKEGIDVEQAKAIDRRFQRYNIHTRLFATLALLPAHGGEEMALTRSTGMVIDVDMLPTHDFEGNEFVD